ncbi:outer membrane beta-barrel protein [Sphingomonas natans]|uniref:outer membrane beta-barrel protein n=1 Tax=Sphingomonas natans TaxID=3063330 RepID=UPI003D66FA9D
MAARNIQTASLAHFAAKGAVAGDLGVLLDSTVSVSRNSGLLASAADSRQVDFKGGIGYVSQAPSEADPGAANIVAIDLRYVSQHGLADRSVLVNSDEIFYRADFVERSLGLRLEYASAPVWGLKGRVGYSEHVDRSGIARNARGLTGDGSIAWSPSPFLTLTIQAARSFSGTQDIYSNGIKTFSWGLAASAQPAEGWTAALQFNRRNRTFQYDLQAAAPLTQSRTEDLSTASTSLAHTVAERVSVSLLLEHRWRASNLQSYRYRGTSATLSLSIPITR